MAIYWVGEEREKVKRLFGVTEWSELQTLVPMDLAASPRSYHFSFPSEDGRFLLLPVNKHCFLCSERPHLKGLKISEKQSD